MTRLVIISDTHERHRDMAPLPEGDVLISCGDETLKGSLTALEDFCAWFKEQPHKQKLFIFGNHSVGTETSGSKREASIQMVRGTGAHYLEDSGIEIDGLHYWGSPVQPRFFDREWNRDRGADIAKHWDKIPDDTNVLITHGPPFDILDQAPRGFGEFDNVGCQDLLARIKQLKQLRLNCFGHIHHAHGLIEQDGVIFANAAICDERYKPTNDPIVVEIAK